MKLLRLKLKNFISVYVTMNRKEIDIDFTKCKNNIILLVGANGSGKTSLLSNMQPFPSLGTLDLRNSQDLILEGEDGYKLIEYQSGKDIYKIEHHYLWNNGRRKTSCYIKLNGKELNPSGLVGSFNDIIKMYFQLDSSFLKMIRLGPNVTDIIKMKTTERKEYIGALLAEVDIYNKYFKIANDESKYLKNVIKMVSSKIDKIEDLSQLEESKKALEEQIEETKVRKSKLEKELYTLTGEYKAKILDESTKQEFISVFENTKNVRNDYKRWCDQRNLDSYDEFLKAFESIKQRYDECKRDFDVNKSILDRLNDTYNTELGRITDLENKIKLLTSEQSLEHLYQTQDQIKEEMSELEYDKSIKGNYSDYKYLYTTYESIINIIKEINEYSLQSLEIIKEECQGYKDIDNMIKGITDYCNSKMKKLSEKIAASKMTKVEYNKGVILYIPSGCKTYDKCPYFRAIRSNAKDTKKSLTTLNNEFDHYMEVKDIFGKFNGIRTSLQNIRNIEKIEDQFKIDDLEVLISILNHNAQYWKNILKEADDYLVKAQNNETLDKLNNTLKQVESDIESIINNSEYTTCSKSLEEAKVRANDLKKEISKVYTDMRMADDAIESLSFDYKSMQDIIDLHRRFNFDEIEANYNKVLDNSRLEKELRDLTSTYQTAINSCEDSIKSMENKLINEILYKINEKKSAEEEKATLEDKFEYVEIIKESLSSTKGIPLIFIQLYLKNIQMLANGIIHRMFGENLTLLDFVISEKEFSIPYMVNGIQVKDVSFASQGERSAMVMGLSFAMLQQYMSIYNVMLFDELDGPLDVRNKKRFIEIVEDQMKAIGAEQAIMITHNNLFENYPVDLILTSSNMENDFNNSNIIWSV